MRKIAFFVFSIAGFLLIIIFLFGEYHRIESSSQLTHMAENSKVFLCGKLESLKIYERETVFLIRNISIVWNGNYELDENSKICVYGFLDKFRENKIIAEKIKLSN